MNAEPSGSGLHIDLFHTKSKRAQASFHPTDKLTLPEGLHLLFIPPRSPELQPAERLWPLTNEAIADRGFASLDELENITAHRCRVLMNRLEFMREITEFHCG